ncbi:MAG TPA: hypothetical protein VGV38_19415 [Pyrinomonadaceae bacterium]|nr:hypothetical protein [Pyrinomonadaceae bacterium]
MEHFVNTVYGWTCRRCRAEEEARVRASEGGEGRGRFFSEGEAEGGGPEIEARSLARWKDEARRTLVCTRCGVEETLGEEG